MTLQDLLAMSQGGGTFGPAMPVPQSAIPQGPQPAPLGSLANGGMTALQHLLPAMFAGARSSTAAPATNNAAPAAGQAPAGVTAGAGNPGNTMQPAVPMPLPRPQAAQAPMDITAPNPGPSMPAPAQPNPTLQSSQFGASPAGPNAGAPGGASNPSMVQSFVNAMRAAQPPQAQPQQPQNPAGFGGGQGQGILPKAMNDGSQLMKLFQSMGGPAAAGAGAAGGAAAAGAGGGFTGMLAGLF